MADITININGSSAPTISTSTKTTLAAEEHSPECPCAHRHENDKTVRPCEAREATAPVIYEASDKLVEPGQVLAFYDGKVVDMKYVPEGRQRFNLAAMRIVDNGAEGYVLEGGKKGDKLFFIGKGSRTSKPVKDEATRERVLAEMRAALRGGAAEVPGPLASAAGAAVGSVAAAALAAEESTSPCAPFTRVVNDEEKFKVCLARQRKIGPLKNEKTVYELIRHDMASRTTECFIVVGTDIHGELRVYSEVARGEIDRVAVDPADIMQRVLGTCSGFFCAHNHPSSKVRPSKADLDLTAAITDATRPFPKVVFLDHLVCGADSFYSIRAHHPKLFKK